jgi:hypothetical protein
VRRLLLATLLIAACVAASVATAGPFLGPASKQQARAGQSVRIRAGAGLHMYALLPLYLVRADVAPKDGPCRMRNGAVAICAPRSIGPPQVERYHRIGTLNVRHVYERTITFRVPHLARGLYVYVMYCGPCYRGPAGSLIRFNAPTLTVI